MSKAKTQRIPQTSVKAASAEYKVMKNRLARIAVKDSQTMAFLHARGLDVEPKGLAAALRAAIAQIEALYRAKPGQEGLTSEEVEAARSGRARPAALPAAPAPTRSFRALWPHASLIHTGLTTRQTAARLGVSDARVRQRLQARTPLAVREGLSWKLPVFQFTKRGELPGWGQVCLSLPSAASPVAVERWLRLPHPDLVTGENETPISPSADGCSRVGHPRPSPPLRVSWPDACRSSPNPQPQRSWRRSEPTSRCLPAGTRIWRVYFQAGAHPTTWGQFRAWGPTDARLDHHVPPPSVQTREIPLRDGRPDGGHHCNRRGVPGEQGRGADSRAPTWVAFDCTRDLRLLDLTDTWPTRAGASMAITSGQRARARRWSQAIYTVLPRCRWPPVRLLDERKPSVCRPLRAYAGRCPHGLCSTACSLTQQCSRCSRTPVQRWAMLWSSGRRAETC